MPNISLGIAWLIYCMLDGSIWKNENGNKHIWGFPLGKNTSVQQGFGEQEVSKAGG